MFAKLFGSVFFYKIELGGDFFLFDGLAQVESAFLCDVAGFAARDFNLYVARVVERKAANVKRFGAFVWSGSKPSLIGVLDIGG